MRHLPITAQLFAGNRERLRALLPPGSLVVVNANDIPPTNADGELKGVPNSDLFYLAGVAQEESVLVLFPDAHDERSREILFLRETNDQVAQWEGHKLSKDQARKATGIARIEWLSEFPVLFRRLMCEAESVWLNSNEHGRAIGGVESRDERFARATQRDYPLHTYRRLARLLHQLRPVKSGHELRLIQHAIDITRDGFARVAKFVKPGVNECEIEAEFAHEFIWRGARFAYRPIVASGKNACVLHYGANNQPCKKGDLLLLDVGAAYANYNADLTRTIPVGGKFSRRQKQVYQAVLRVLRASTAALTPGKLPKDWQKESEAFMQEELLALGLIKQRDIKKQEPDKPALKKYFMHGIGHPLGLDVHDVATPGAPIAEGWVMTVEPGIYLPEEGFAVRLEDDVLVTATGPENLMGAIPIEPGEIEEMMRH